jgi:hypothetical protein
MNKESSEPRGMEIVNPIAGSLAQSTAVTRQQATDKSQQIRRAQALRKDVASASDTFEHQVESTEELTPIHEEQKNPTPRRRPSKPKRPAAAKGSEPEKETHIDITG